MKKWYLSFFVLVGGHLFGQDTVPLYNIVPDSLETYTLSHLQYEMLYDTSGKFSWKEVTSGPVESRFRVSITPYNLPASWIKATWMRFRLKNTTAGKIEIAIGGSQSRQDFYVVRSNGKWEHQKTGYNLAWKERDGYKSYGVIAIVLNPLEEVLVYEREKTFNPLNISDSLRIDICNSRFIEKKWYVESLDSGHILDDASLQFFFFGILFFAFVINLLFFFIVREKVYLYYASYLLFLLVSRSCGLLTSTFFKNFSSFLEHANFIGFLFNGLTFLSFTLFVRSFLNISHRFPVIDKIILLLSFMPVIASIALEFSVKSEINNWGILILRILLFVTIISYWRTSKRSVRLMIVAVVPVLVIRGLGWSSYYLFSQLNKFFGIAIPSPVNWLGSSIQPLELFGLAWLVLLFSWVLFQRFIDLRNKVVIEALAKERIEKEKETERKELIELQKAELERQVEDRTAALRKSIEELKTTQSQLIQAEKMASLGELTAGIAHEIQNPLNFVNNFSDVNKELIVEMREEIDKGNIEEVKAIANDIEENEVKINHHGKRADAIVKGMLEHSRTSKGEKQPTDINALADEYLRLAYHGLRAKDKNFNASFKTDFDDRVDKIQAAPQDIGRVLLNLYNNAFYAVNEKKKQLNGTFEPTVEVSTKQVGDKVAISVRDNGTGIPQKVLDKIYQPFFTTKPTGQGTGLGLSLSYDIITKGHGGELKVDSKEGEGAEFIIQLPVKM